MNCLILALIIVSVWYILGYTIVLWAFSKSKFLTIRSFFLCFKFAKDGLINLYTFRSNLGIKDKFDFLNKIIWKSKKI